MRLVRLILIVTLVVFSAATIAVAQDRGAPGAQRGAAGGQRGGGPAMTLTTSAWPDGDPIPVKYTQAAEQISPELKWANAPAGTQSFVLHMHDPDVRSDRRCPTVLSRLARPARNTEDLVRLQRGRRIITRLKSTPSTRRSMPRDLRTRSLDRQPSKRGPTS